VVELSFQVPINHAVPGIFTLTGVLTLTVMGEPVEPQQPTPPPAPEPLPKPIPQPELFDLHIWVKDTKSNGITGALVTRMSNSDERTTSGEGHTHFAVSGPDHYAITAAGFVGTVADLPPGRHNVHLAREIQAARPGGVRLENRGYVDDDGPFLSCDYTDMSALRLYEHDNARYVENCREMRARGATAHRILGMVGWPGREIDARRPDLAELTRATIQTSYGLGLRTRFTMFADLNVLPSHSNPSRPMAMPERREHARAMARDLRGITHMLEAIEVCNEPGHTQYNGPWTPEQMVEIARIIKAELPQVLVGCGAPWGDPHSATNWTEENYRALMAQGLGY
jgi:hypothetical protein